LLQQANDQQQTLRNLRGDSDTASETQDTLDQSSPDEQEQPVPLSQQRLSTGLRINRAQDDPAGLDQQADDKCDDGDQALQDADSELEQANQAPQTVLQLFR
jgi:flagellin-like hook-associated protein FlgL